MAAAILISVLALALASCTNKTEIKYPAATVSDDGAADARNLNAGDDRTENHPVSTGTDERYSVEIPAPLPTGEHPFVLSVNCAEKGVDLEGIRFDVYGSALAYSEPGGYSEYEHEYAFTVVTDKDGKALFDKPAEAISITPRLDSLPFGYGTDTYTRFCEEPANGSTFDIYEVKRVELIFDPDDENKEVFACAFAEDGRQVWCEKTVDESPDPEFEIDEQSKTVRCKKTVNAAVCGIEITGTKTYEHEFQKDRYLYKYLLDNDVINKHVFMYYYCREIVAEGGYFEPSAGCVVIAGEKSEGYYKVKEYYEEYSDIVGRNSPIKQAYDLLCSND